MFKIKAFEKNNYIQTTVEKLYRFITSTNSVKKQYFNFKTK